MKPKTILFVYLRITVVLGIVFLAAGCKSIGPGGVQRDRLDYAGAIADSWKEQTLLNITKLRYLDQPVFLEVSSIIGSYTLQGEVSLNARIFPDSRTSTYNNFGATGIFTDRPTITYTPVTGRRYIESLLRPIPPSAIFAMMQSGHAADFILRLAVRAINDIHNFSASPARARREDPAFRQVIEALRRIQQAGVLGVRIEKRRNEEVTLVFFRDKVQPDLTQDIAFVRNKLGIEPGARELLLTYGGSAQRGGDEIALLSRSMMEIMSELAAGVDVPQQHLAEGRARSVGETGPDEDTREYRPVHIHSGSAPPADAYAAVRYRDYWFWIDDRDLTSKRVFTFLMMFSSIAETGTVPQAPIITIPAN